MSQHSFLGPTPAEDYDEEEADVVDDDCDDMPLTLGVFNLMPDVNAPVPGDPSRPAGDPSNGRLPFERVRPPILPSMFRFASLYALPLFVRCPLFFIVWYVGFRKAVDRFPLKAGPDIRGAALPSDNEQAGPSAPRGSSLLASNDVSRYQMMAMDPYGYMCSHCPFLCVKLLLEKLPTPCAVDALFLKANDQYQKKNLWYIAQPLGIRTLSERVKAVTGYSSHCLKRTGATALAEDETCSDEFRLAMGGWKSRDAMAAYAHHGVAKRAKASALMSSQVCVPLPAPAVPAAVPPPTPTVSSAEAAVPPSTPSAVHPPNPCHTPSLGVCVGEGVAPGSCSTPPPPNPLMHGFAKWPSSGVAMAEQMAMMSHQMAAFQVQMQLTSLQMQVQVMQQSMLPKKE
ncbi:hypothetical protein QJQ45_016925 [Haematococcus lacustris]|nr:hypothetical protein QJQ45_016925 [Haematococcus lacustris]